MGAADPGERGLAVARMPRRAPDQARWRARGRLHLLSSVLLVGYVVVHVVRRRKRLRHSTIR